MYESFIKNFIRSSDASLGDVDEDENGLELDKEPSRLSAPLSQKGDPRASS